MTRARGRTRPEQKAFAASEERARIVAAIRKRADVREELAPTEITPVVVFELRWVADLIEQGKALT